MRLTLIALVLLAAVACGTQASTLGVEGTVAALVTATATPAPSSTAAPAPTRTAVILAPTPMPTPALAPTATPAPAGNFSGGIVQDFLDTTKARITKENVINAYVPTGIRDAKREVLYMRKAAEWKGSGNAIIDASGVPAGDVTIMWAGPQTLVVDMGGRTFYPDTNGPIPYMNQLYRKDQPLRFSVLAPTDKSWVITVAMPVLAQ